MDPHAKLRGGKGVVALTTLGDAVDIESAIVATLDALDTIASAVAKAVVEKIPDTRPLQTKVVLVIPDEVDLLFGICRAGSTGSVRLVTVFAVPIRLGCKLARSAAVSAWRRVRVPAGFHASMSCPWRVAVVGWGVV